MHDGQPVYLRDIALISDGPEEALAYSRIGYSHHARQQRDQNVGQHQTDQQALEDSHIAMGRSAKPAEIGKSAVYLASDLASYVTGVALPVAGGMAPGL